MSNIKVGILALQGDFAEHIAILKQLGVDVFPVRLPGQLDSLDGLIIPGGESTTILKLMHTFGLIQPLREMAKSGFPIWGTCAGLICLASKVVNRTSNNHFETLAVMDMTVRRNAFGRQIDSFETELPLSVLGDKPFPAVFIRAPVILETGSQIEPLARLDDGTVVACRQGKLLATAFHPELTNDSRFHSYFLQIAASAR